MKIVITLMIMILNFSQAIAEAKSELHPNEWSFKKIIDSKHINHLPENLIITNESFTTYSNQFDKFSRTTQGILTFNNGHYTISQDSYKDNDFIVHKTNTLDMPQCFIQADFKIIKSTKNNYENVGVGLFRNIDNYLYTIANFKTQKLEIQVRVNGKLHILKTTSHYIPKTFKLGMSLVTNNVSIYIHRGRGWDYVLTEKVGRFHDFSLSSYIKNWYPSFAMMSDGEGTFTASTDNLKFGRFGGTGIKDITLVTNPDGSPYYPSKSNVYFTATIANPNGNCSTGIFILNLENYKYEQIGAIAFDDGKYTRNLLPVHLIHHNNGNIRVTASTFTGIRQYGLKILHKLETELNLLKGSNVVSNIVSLNLPMIGANPGVYDSFLIYDNKKSRWLMAYTNTEDKKFVTEIFYPAGAWSTDLVNWNLIGYANVDKGDYEGTKISNVNDTYYIFAGGPTDEGDDIMIYNSDTMELIGINEANLEGGMDTQPHPTMVPYKDKQILLTFDNTNDSNKLFSWGNFQIYESNRY